MIIRIAIAEDVDKSAETIESYISQFSEETGQKFEVTRFADGQAVIDNYQAVFDIIFLDIKMPIMDGMTAAEHIRKKDKNVILIFITNMAQYAIKGYSVDALDFLLKPVPYFAFASQLKRSIERLSTSKDESILLSCEGGMLKMNISDILYIESFKHRLLVHTKDNSYSTQGTMREFEGKLQGKTFFRCNNCYLVNLRYVKNILNNEVSLEEVDTTLVISRPRKKAFLEALAEYIGKGSIKSGGLK